MCQARFSVALTSEHDLPIQCSPASNKKVNSLALFLLGYFTVTLLLGHFLTRGPIRHTLFLVCFFFFSFGAAVWWRPSNLADQVGVRIGVLLFALPAGGLFSITREAGYGRGYCVYHPLRMYEAPLLRSCLPHPKPTFEKM